MVQEDGFIEAMGPDQEGTGHCEDLACILSEVGGPLSRQANRLTMALLLTNY